MNWIKFVTAEDLSHEVGAGHEVLVFDGCDYFIDYVEIEVEHGSYFMANGSKPEFYCRLTDPVMES